MRERAGRGAHRAGLAVLRKFAVAVVHDHYDPRVGPLDDFDGRLNISDAQRRPQRVPAGALDERHAHACATGGARRRSGAPPRAGRSRSRLLTQQQIVFLMAPAR